MDSISDIVQAYAFTDTDKQHITDMLAKSYLLAKTQAYQKAVATTKHVVTLHHPWTPQEYDVRKAQRWAKEQVKGVADTYETMLQHAIEQVLQQKHESISDIVGSIKQVVAAIGDWFQKFLPWKSQQIADQTWRTGSNDGTDEWIGDVLIANNIDGDISNIRVQVMPEESSSDFCKEIIVNEANAESEHVNRPTFLFIDIDGVLSIANAGNPSEMIDEKESWPIPIANELLQFIDSSDSFYPIWMTHWGNKANGWNERAGIEEWPSWYPLSAAMEEAAHDLFPHLDKKLLSLQYCMYIHQIDSAIWVQDGFEPEDVEWAKQANVTLVDTRAEPLHSLLLSEQLQPETFRLFVGEVMALIYQ
jgi:hypothetical protein